MRVVILGAAVIMSFLPNGHARQMELSPYELGMELELQPQAVRNIVDFFDLSDLEERATFFNLNLEKLEERVPIRNLISTEAVDHYLANDPSAINGLPKPIQEKLMSGLKLGSSIQKPQSSRAIGPSTPIPQRLIHKPSEPVTPMSGLDSIFPPSGLEFINKTRDSGLMVPGALDWQIVDQRWRAIPLEQRRSLVRFNSLDRTERARLLHFDFYHARLRADLPAEEKKFWQKFKLKADGTALEIVHDGPVATAEEFLDDLRGLTRRAGVERHVFNPAQSTLERQQRVEDQIALLKAQGKIKTEEEIAKAYRELQDLEKWGSFHFHLSVEGRDLRSIERLSSIFLLVRRLREGIHSDLGVGSYTFAKREEVRGLTRLVGFDHYEVRAHIDPPEVELNRFLSWAAGNDGLARASQEILNRLDEPTLQRIMNSYRATDILETAFLSFDDSSKVALAERILKFVDIDKVRWTGLTNNADPSYIESLKEKILAFEGSDKQKLEILNKALYYNPEVRFFGKLKLIKELKEDPALYEILMNAPFRQFDEYTSFIYDFPREKLFADKTLAFMYRNRGEIDAQAALRIFHGHPPPTDSLVSASMRQKLFEAGICFH